MKQTDKGQCRHKSRRMREFHDDDDDDDVFFFSFFFDNCEKGDE